MIWQLGPFDGLAAPARNVVVREFDVGVVLCATTRLPKVSVWPPLGRFGESCSAVDSVVMVPGEEKPAIL